MTSISNRLFTAHKTWSRCSVMPAGLYSLDINGTEQSNTSGELGEMEI
jgi:hypothetical protein